LIPVLILALLMALPVQVRIVYEGRGRKWNGQLKLGMFKGRLGLKIDLPPAPKIPKRPALTRNRAGGSYKLQSGVNRASVSFLVQWRRWRNLITGIKRSVGVFKGLLHRSVCTRLLWETGFGLDDYATTGMIAGLLWAGKGLIMGLLSRHLRIRPAGVRIAVVPRFGSACYVSTLDCILETSLGYIILVVFKLGAIWLVRKELFVRGKHYA
jgi:hypothetical protein